MIKRSQIDPKALAKIDAQLAAQIKAGNYTVNRGTFTAPKKKRKPSHVWGEMNKTEERHMLWLQNEFPGATILFEAVTLRLDKRTTYTPDFCVVRPGHETNHIIAFVEVKGGFRREDSWQKLKWAADKFCRLWRFYLATEKDGVWRLEVV